jgi:hypothetical protein
MQPHILVLAAVFQELYNKNNGVEGRAKLASSTDIPIDEIQAGLVLSQSHISEKCISVSIITNCMYANVGLFQSNFKLFFRLPATFLISKGTLLKIFITK